LEKIPLYFLCVLYANVIATGNLKKKAPEMLGFVPQTPLASPLALASHKWEKGRHARNTYLIFEKIKYRSKRFLNYRLLHK
jgi:hypothetical protein